MGILYLVGTPIGNLEDITLRALRILREVPLIAAEDTRATRRLLDHFEIRQPLVSYFEHNEQARVEYLLGRLAEGDVALVSEAGMPGISDPGFDLVRAAIANGFRVEPIPGPSAPIAALAASGLPTSQFVYLGFLPRKPAERRKALAALRDERRTLVAFEAPHRLVATLRDLDAELGARPLVVARELTKLHEEFVRGSAVEVLAHFEMHPPRGEITLVIAGASEEASGAAVDLEARIAALRGEGLAAGEIASRLARETGAPRRQVYRLLLEGPGCAKM
jgi:16S rRNA (cytidine1402-2'-O)-methyltransferase